MEEKNQGLTAQEKIDRILSAITNPEERAEKEQLLKVLVQLGEGSSKTRNMDELLKAVKTGSESK